MSVRILAGLHDVDVPGAVLFDSVTGWAFGPVFDSAAEAEAFRDWLPDDARSYEDNQLEQLYEQWLRAGRP